GPPAAEVCTVSLPDALPICVVVAAEHAVEDRVADERGQQVGVDVGRVDRLHDGVDQRLPVAVVDECSLDLGDGSGGEGGGGDGVDRKSTRLNSSHVKISYAV